MAIGSRIGGQIKSAANLYVKVNGGWRPAQQGFVRVPTLFTSVASGLTWSQFWSAEILDTFGRANANSLGNSESGQAWTVLRGAWRVQSNFANTLSTKTEYPLATINMGIGDFELEANELSPGTGVAIRVFDANNWTAIVPYYNQTSTTYTYCVSARTESYCIAACTEPAGYNTVCYGTETPAYTAYRDEQVGYGCVTTTTPGSRTCGLFGPPVATSVTTCAEDTYEVYSYCARFCETTSTSCVPTSDNCIREDGRTRCFARPPTCTTTTSTSCCQTFFETRRIPGVCTTTTEYTEACIYYITTEGTTSTTCEGYRTVSTPYTVAATCSTGYQQVPYYNCCQFGSRQVCEVFGTGTTFNQFYYIRVINMVNGVITNTDIETGQRWNAIKVTGVGITLSINVYSDAAYTQLVKTTSVSNATSASSYGIIAAPSIYEDGRNIGAIKVKAFGQ